MVNKNRFWAWGKKRLREGLEQEGLEQEGLEQEEGFAEPGPPREPDEPISLAQKDSGKEARTEDLRGAGEVGSEAGAYHPTRREIDNSLF